MIPEAGAKVDGGNAVEAIIHEEDLVVEEEEMPNERMTVTIIEVLLNVENNAVLVLDVATMVQHMLKKSP